MKKYLNLILTLAVLLMGANSYAIPARPDTPAKAPATLRGTVADSTDGQPAGWATVALSAADSTIVAGTACDEKGVYELKAPAGEYTLTVSLIGYRNHSQHVSLSAGSNELPAITIEPDAQMLAGATLTERVKLVEMKIDKVVVNVKESAFAQGSNALELIKKAPGVTVDKDGNIKLNGKAVSVWIDGRPSYADGKTLESLLRSTNGESIDKFELMEHPSAKYDASGQGGIINIKTKRNHIQGFNGSLGLGGGGMSMKNMAANPWQESAWANLAYRTKKTNSFLNVYEGTYVTPMSIVNDLSVLPADFRQVGVSDLLSRYFAYSVKFGTDWFIDDNNTLGAIVNVPGSVYTFNSLNSSTWQYVLGRPVSSAQAAVTNGPNRSVRHNVNLNYTHIFDAARSAELTANLDYCHNGSKNANGQTDTTIYMANPSEKILSSQTMTSKNIYDIYSAKADYQTVVAKKYMLEAGGKWALSRTDNKSVETQTMMPDRLSDFVYSEHVAALYASFAGQIGPKWSFKAGLRGEFTHSLGDWRSSGNRTVRNYFDVFPTIYFGYTPSEKYRISLSYSRRINRPDYGELNPTKTYVDAKTYTVGNPDILPQYSDNVTFTTGFGQYLSLSLGYEHTGKVVEQIPTFDPSGIQYLTWGNAGTQQFAYAALNVSGLPLGKWLQWTLSLSGAYIHMKNNLSGKSSGSWMANGYTEFSFLLPKDWKIALDGSFSTPMTWGYFRMHGYWDSNIAVKKTLLDNRLVLSLRFDDIFRSSRMNLDIVDETGAGAVTALRQTFGGQKLVFDLTWSFGQAQKPLRYRRVGNLEEMSRVGSGNGGGIGK